MCSYIFAHFVSMFIYLYSFPLLSLENIFQYFSMYDIMLVHTSMPNCFIARNTYIQMQSAKLIIVLSSMIQIFMPLRTVEMNAPQKLDKGVDKGGGRGRTALPDTSSSISKRNKNKRNDFKTNDSIIDNDLDCTLTKVIYFNRNLDK